MNDRDRVAKAMVIVHLVPRELADVWAATMDQAEIDRRFAMYARQGHQFCAICGDETPCCRCDYAVLEQAAQLQIANERWREQTRKEQAEQMAGMELSAVERNQQSGPDFYQVFGFATATARFTALNPVPELPTEARNGEESARAGSKKPGPVVGRALSAAH